MQRLSFCSLFLIILVILLVFGSVNVNARSECRDDRENQHHLMESKHEWVCWGPQGNAPDPAKVITGAAMDVAVRVGKFAEDCAHRWISRGMRLTEICHSDFITINRECRDCHEKIHHDCTSWHGPPNEFEMFYACRKK